jgi:hypothetical protein
MPRPQKRRSRGPAAPIDINSLHPPYRIRAWCALRNLPLSTFKLRAQQGLAPRIVHVGGVHYITEEADQEWMRRLNAGELAVPPRGRPRRKANVSQERTEA